MSMHHLARDQHHIDHSREVDIHVASAAFVEANPELNMIAIITFGITVVCCFVLRRVLSKFRSAEVKHGAHQIVSAPGISKKLPLVGGIAAVTAGATAAGMDAGSTGVAAAWWVVSGAAAFFAFGLVDDIRKTRIGRGIGEGAYLIATLGLSVLACTLLVGPGMHLSNALSPYSLAHWVGAEARLPISMWYFTLILGTSLATSFSDGMDGLAPGTVAITGLGAALVCGISTSITNATWPLIVSAMAGGVLVWNLPSRWSPANPNARRLATIYLGDSGALFLGAASAVAAIVAGVDLLWPIIAAPLLLEGLSSMLQAKILVPIYRRWRDPRLPDGTLAPHQQFPLPLLASPLHYHWEIVGLDRRQIALGFWATTALTTVFAALAARMPDAGLAALMIILSVIASATFWGAAMWTRPAFVASEGNSLLLFHGRPLRIVGLRLAWQQRVVGGGAMVRAARHRGIMNQPMNAHRLESVIRDIHAEHGQSTP